MADPHVIKVDGTYYLYPTSGADTYLGNPGFEVWTSTNLVNWDYGGLAWQPQNAGFYQPPRDCGFWAPSVIADEDGYWMHYSANCRIGLAHSGSPLGPFTDVFDHPFIGNGYGGIGNGVLGEQVRDYDELAIDAFIFRDDDGRLYLYFAYNSPMENIAVLPLADMRTIEPGAQPRDVFDIEATGWEFVVREGPWVEKHDGRYYLTYSGNLADNSAYAVGYAVADNPLGPFERFPGNPVFKADPAAGLFGPGHHSLVEGLHDDRLMFYHSKASAEIGWDRRVKYTPVCWDGDGLLKVHPPSP